MCWTTAARRFAILAMIFLSAPDGAGRVEAADCIQYAGHLARLGGLDTPGTARDLALDGDIACVAAGTAGLQVFDVSDPGQPVLRSTVDTPGDAVAVACGGGWAFVADLTAGVRIVDISDPAAAHEVTVVSYAGSTWDVVLAGQYIYVAKGADGLRSFRVTDPAHPAANGSLAGSFMLLAAGTGYLYACSYTSDVGLSVISLANPGTPVLVSTLVPPGASEGGPARVSWVHVADGGGCLTSYSSWPSSNWSSAVLRVLDLADPAHPALRDTCGGEVESTGGVIPLKGLVAGHRIYATESSGGGGHFRVHDASDPDHTIELGGLECTGGPLGVTARDGLLFASEGTAGLQVYAVEPPTSPPLVIARRTLASVAYQTMEHVVAAANCSYLSRTSREPPYMEEPSMLTAVDLESAQFVNFGFTPYPQFDMALEAARLFVASAGGVIMYDVTNPLAPVALATRGPECHDLALRDGTAWLAAYWNGLVALDVTTPTSAHVVGSVSLPNDAREVVLGDGYAYVFDGALRVVDIANPAAPLLVGGADLPMPANDLVVDAGLLLVALGDGVSGGLQLWDLSLPGSPSPRGLLPLRMPAAQVTTAGRQAYVFCGRGGIAVVDISDPDAPVLVGEADAVNAGDGVVHGGRLLFSDQSDLVTGLLDCGSLVGVRPDETPPASRRLGSSPNPFNPRVVIAFTLAAPDLVTVEVFDLAGRRVATPAPAALRAAGRHEAVWDGRDFAGRCLASGTYAARLRGREVVDSVLLTLVR